MTKKIFISPYKNNWRVEAVGEDELTSLHSTKAEALLKARLLANETGAELLVEHSDGTITWKFFTI